METRLLRSGPEACREGAELILDGQVVGIPTETVYGLAASAFDPEAVRRIFEAKGRPADNPLIVHIATWQQLEDVATDIPPGAYTLGRAFWPGPLTMILKRSGAIPDVVTAGLDTVGVRMPAHPTAREIISLSTPLAAPSANTSGRPSPTAAAHVFEDMQGRIPMIIDGGRCSVGVESTVVDMTGEHPRVLRPGAITEEMIAAVLGEADTDRAAKVGLAPGEKAKSPGMKYRHYAPKAPVTLFEGSPQDTFEAICRQYEKTDGIICFDEYTELFKERGFKRLCSLGPSWDHGSHSQRLFAILRHFDSTKAARILAQCPRPLGAGQGTVNRLRKAAGFVCIPCSQKEIIGLTGASGSGKSLMAGYMKEAMPGCQVLDADQVYHDMIKNPGALAHRIERAFPGSCPYGVVDRKILGDMVFGHPERLALLNSITHSHVIEFMLEQIALSDSRYYILDVPLLFESGLDRYCTVTIGLTASRQESCRRIEQRDNIDAQRAQRRLDSQKEPEFYTARCDFMVENNGSPEALAHAAHELAGKILNK